MEARGLGQWILKAKDGEKGMFGESLWSAIFRAAGLNYMSLCRIDENCAPMMWGREKLILPDFNIQTNAYDMYVDAKVKSGPVYWRHGNEWRHGIHRRNWLHYKEIAGLGRRHCCIAIFECFTDEKSKTDWSGALLINSLFRLGDPIPGIGTMEDTVFFPRQRFAVLGQVSEQEARDICNRHGAASRFGERLREILELCSAEPVQRTLW